MQQPNELLEKYLQEQRRVYPAHLNRASQLGHPCERYLFYQRTAWQEADPPSVRLQGIFLFGKEYEQWLRRQLGEAGYHFRQPSRPFVWREFEISGTDDGDVSWDGGNEWHQAEIKGLHPFFWSAIDHWRDFLKSHIYAKYPAQGQIYMLLRGIERLVFILGRKGSLDIKWLWMELDYEYAESILKKAERVNAAVRENVAPPQLNDVDVCDGCEFRQHCKPEVFTAAARFTDAADVIAAIAEREYLRDTRRAVVKGYERAQETFEAAIGDREVTIAGPWQVIRKMTKGAKPHPRYTVRRLDADVVEGDDDDDDGDSPDAALPG